MSSLRNFSWIGVVLAVWPVSEAPARDGWVLPEVVVEAPAGEVLTEDPVLPQIEEDLDFASAPRSGTAADTLGDGIALPVIRFGSGKAGNSAQFRGVGRSAEDTAVRALGIPLNPPQGGGFDLSAFPAFVWGGYRYRAGGMPAAADPRGVSGDLVLEPRTARMIRRRSRHRLLGASALDGGAQFYGGGRFGDTAVVAGGFTGAVRGGAGSVSARLSENLRFHLLASRRQTEVDGTLQFPTPDARQDSWRILPVVEADFRTGDLLFKNSFYADAGRIVFRNPAPVITTEDFTGQAGWEGAWVSPRWRVGSGLRLIDFRPGTLDVPVEAIGYVQGGPTLRVGEWTFEPIAGMSAVSRLGGAPIASVGARRAGLYARVGTAPRYPSLLDRHYRLPGFYEGNPDLAVERQWNAVLGWERLFGRWTTRHELLAQYRSDPQIPAADGAGLSTRINSGNAWMAGLTQELRWGDDVWEFHSAATLSFSRVSALAEPYPYLPALSHRLSGRWSPFPEAFAELRLHSQTSRLDAVSGERLNGFSSVDAMLGGRINPDGGPAVDWRLQVSNLFDRPLQWVGGYPAAGRGFSASVVGRL